MSHNGCIITGGSRLKNPVLHIAVKPAVKLQGEPALRPRKKSSHYYFHMCRGGGSNPHGGLYGDAPPEKDAFFALTV